MKDSTTIVFGVRKTGEATCLAVDSNGETGWHFANLETKEFGLVLDYVLKAVK